MAQAHGTRYSLKHEPFAAFDLFRKGKRILFEELKDRCARAGITIPFVLHLGEACSVSEVMERLGEKGYHGAIDPAEGAVWRCERKGKVDFLAKYVRPEKVDGIYLENVTDQAPVWNWHPEHL